MLNQDNKTVESFGDEWTRMSQDRLDEKERGEIFGDYFSIFPFDLINTDSIGFDMGCGSGRWAAVIAPKVKKIFCIDASLDAINVAKENLKSYDNIEYQVASVDQSNLESDSCDFGYSLGVLHHLPDTASAISSCSVLLKKDAPFLLYLYYAFDNKPIWYKQIWKISELARGVINRMPPTLKFFMSNIIAATVYYPFARLAKLLSITGFSVDNFPLSYYRDKSFYTMCTDSRDRFGTPLEKRFSKIEIEKMMENAGFYNIRFSRSKPYWVAVGRKKY
jgi:SAM-dependent methyltransferase